MKLRLQSAFIMTTFNYEEFLSERLLPVVFGTKHFKKGGAGGGEGGRDDFFSLETERGRFALTRSVA